jgi:hypothetical protein
MAIKQHTRSYCNPLPRLSGPAQEARLTGEIYTEDKKGAAFDALLKSLRKGDVVELVELFLLAPAKLKTFKRRRALTDRIEAIKARGGILSEVSTGDRSDNGHLPRMMMRAYEMMGKAGQGYAGRGKQGRPPKERSTEELQVMEFEWVNRRNKTIADAIIALRRRKIKNPTVAELYRHFGSRIAGKAGKET